MRFFTALLSDKGGRDINQDFAAFCECEHGGCWVLADGLGGYQAGEIAAKLTVETILQEYQQYGHIHAIKNGIEKSQTLLHEQQRSSPVMRSMRTTVVVLSCFQNFAHWVHVGDSRLYHFRGRQLISQTKDHSVCQALVNAGEITQNQIRFHEDRNRLYRVLGSDGEAKPTLVKEKVQILNGDAFLLCSDGFWEYVMEEEMESTRMIATSTLQWLQLMEEILKKRVTENHDNYSALAIFVSE